MEPSYTKEKRVVNSEDIYLAQNITGYATQNYNSTFSEYLPQQVPKVIMLLNFEMIGIILQDLNKIFEFF